MLNEKELFAPKFTACLQPSKTIPPVGKPNLIDMESALRKKIIGQDAAISAVCRAIRRNAVGLRDPTRPVGCFLFVGATGTGKTELCKALAEYLYGDTSKLIKIDLSEYMSRWDASRLTGAAPGYTGYEEGGQLTNLVLQNPDAVLCLDELEKAHPDVLNIFLQVMNDAVLTSAQGEAVSFREILIIMTSNIGSEAYTKCSTIGFTGDSSEKLEVKSDVNKAIKKALKPEFLNRIDEVVMFNQLTEKDIIKICKIMLEKVKKQAAKLGIKLDFDSKAVVELSRLGFDTEYGARPLKRVIDTKINDMLADMILTEELKSGESVTVTFDGNKFETVNKKAIKTHRKVSKINA